jgi:7-cyano-7-deazaguanine reductase
MTVDKHLGKGSESYEISDKVNPELLVGEPRLTNRESSDIKSNFVGFDIWNAYEFSFLNDRKVPVNTVLKIQYDSNSKTIVESKSLKLYLNTFNFVSFDNTYRAAVQVKNDLERIVGTKVSVDCWYSEFNEKPRQSEFFHFRELRAPEYFEYIPSEGEDRSLLDFKGFVPSNDVMKYHSDLLRSNCKITHQPDWGDLYLYMRADEYPSESSLINYILSFRRENHFHEECCEMIYDRLYRLYDPKELFVACCYTRRGGIDINPVRCSNWTLLDKLTSIWQKDSYHTRTIRQ